MKHCSKFLLTSLLTILTLFSAGCSLFTSDYRPANRDGLTRAQFEEIVKSKKGIWSKEENPLLGLDVVDTDISGDSATVDLIKKSAGKKIELKLNWIGRGWVIVGDNILSEGGVFRL